jgi:hypothetical protein
VKHCDWHFSTPTPEPPEPTPEDLKRWDQQARIGAVEHECQPFLHLWRLRLLWSLMNKVIALIDATGWPSSDEEAKYSRLARDLRNEIVKDVRRLESTSSN